MTKDKSLVRASASVTMTIRVNDCGVWGSECDVAQVHRQAKREALERVGRDLFDSFGRKVKFQIIGEPKVTSVLVEESS